MSIFLENNTLLGLTCFTVRGSASKRSWLVYNPSLTATMENIKCEDDIYKTHPSAVSSRRKDGPLSPHPGGVQLCVKL